MMRSISASVSSFEEVVRGETGVVQQDIQAAAGRRRKAGERGRPLGTVADVEVNRRGVVAPQLGEGSLEACRIDVGETDEPAAAHEVLRRGEADTLRAAGDEQARPCARRVHSVSPSAFSSLHGVPVRCSDLADQVRGLVNRVAERAWAACVADDVYRHAAGRKGGRQVVHRLATETGARRCRKAIASVRPSANRTCTALSAIDSSVTPCSAFTPAWASHVSTWKMREPM